MGEWIDEYGRLLSMQVFDEDEPDYTSLEMLHKQVLTQLAGVSNSVHPVGTQRSL